ncbi:hypothetical protein F511_30631 [Dorcoceras hygrometricum]|uniref:Uncharacterized protein n=1 Tax=Dorcoceras hygrometricum TaxID=472368 RepID=A0A2Z7CMI7_9LAMI|nr:hypothetical protein F511_30631 [Dorcoceras hygrometricum]
MAGLAMETSKAEPDDHNQAKAKLNRDAYVDSFPYVESYVDSNPFVESSVNRYAYMEVQLYLLLVASRTKKSDEVFSLLKMKQQVTVDEAIEESETDEAIEQKLLADTITEAVEQCYDKEKTTAERTAVEQFVGAHSAVGTQSTFKMERING